MAMNLLRNSLFCVLLLSTWSLCLQHCGTVSTTQEHTETTDATSQHETISTEVPGSTDTDQTSEPTTESATTKPCFYNQPTEPGKLPNYKQFNPTVGSHCLGTNHQDIQGVEQIVYVGDSITAGTPPTEESRFFRNTTTAALQKKFGNIPVKNCSKWGARADDLLLKPHEQLPTCLPEDTIDKRTLILFTIGGNDAQAIAKKAQDGASLAEQLKEVEKTLQLLRDAVIWAKDPKRFPKGSFVIFGNVYEYTDGTGDVTSCPAAKAVGLTKPWADGRQIMLTLNEGFMKVAVESRSDMLFMLEEFCGHGFHYDDPKTQCYQPGAQPWFDFTCIHPNPDGHDQITRMMMNVVNE